MGYSGKVRVRSCGIVCRNGQVLLVHLNAPTQKDPFWTVPGGGVQFGERSSETVAREILEETGIIASTERLIAISEFIRPPFHAIEHYWFMNYESGEVITGIDPESGSKQIILDAKWIPVSELEKYPIQPDFLKSLIIEKESITEIQRFGTS